ncbi:acyl-CoA/acyl-ACP dehydrogenase [Sphingomonas sp. So64.6b]|uniref:acyl-CoA dehydrogenase family protein n=1 Tax=Sphingomonas sp. So64.6b TaxID=2997354 RepID=UPI0015FFE6AB|nr:acyl-CoA dehydrogenase family protein [Sphingomonas sp. So64.6b]QNA86636.1 acyl-CoA/acyl-ACP dehydrogenase [Sphingomonas sp. So64.6b]
MDYRISDEQRAIADLAGDLFTGNGDTPPPWSVLEAAGLPQLLVPEALGGVGLGQVDMALVLIEQGRGLVATPLWRHAVAALVLARAGRTPAPGERLTVAVESDASAERTGDRWTLRGTARAVSGAGDAAKAVIVAQAGDRAGLFEIDLSDADVARVDGILTDGEAASDLILTNAPAQLLDVDAGWLRARAAACLAALAVGVARGAVERTAAYVTARHQFDRPIGSFQAVAQRMADAFTDVEVAQTLAMELAWRIDAGADLGNSVEVTTYWANQCSHRVAHAAMHLHGGIGADTSYPIHRVLLMSRALELMLGGSRQQIARIGERLAA